MVFVKSALDYWVFRFHMLKLHCEMRVWYTWSDELHDKNRRTLANVPNIKPRVLEEEGTEEAI